MYLGAWGPSLLQIALFALYTFYLTLVKPAALPPVPRTLFGKALLIKCAWGIIPAAVLIFLVLGTIMMGLATPTEAGAMGAIGAIVLARRDVYSSDVITGEPVDQGLIEKTRTPLLIDPSATTSAATAAGAQPLLETTP